MECCGDEFKTGDKIKWIVCKFDSLNAAVDMGRVDYCYEAHNPHPTERFLLTGTVERIQMLYEKYAPSEDGSHFMIPVGGRLIEAEHVEGFEKPVDDMRLSGYLVDITNYSINKATKDEIEAYSDLPIYKSSVGRKTDE